MLIRGELQVSFTAGQTPGTLLAELHIMGEDGRTVDLASPALVKVGDTLTYGPIAVQVQLEPVFAVSPTTPRPAPAVAPNAGGGSMRAGAGGGKPGAK